MRDLGELSFPKLGRNCIFIEVLIIVSLIIVSFHYKSFEDIKLMIVIFYNCDFKLYFDISSVLELEMNYGLRALILIITEYEIDIVNTFMEFY